MCMHVLFISDCSPSSLGADSRKACRKQPRALGCHPYRARMDIWASMCLQHWLFLLLTIKKASLYTDNLHTWLFQFRDDNKKLHPCLVDFQSLPEPEKNYNLAMSGETLK